MRTFHTAYACYKCLCYWQEKNILLISSIVRVKKYQDFIQSLVAIPFSNICYQFSLMLVRDRSQTLVRGALCKKFSGPPLGPQIFLPSPPPFFPPRKIGINPTENHKDSIFRGEISVIFFQGPPFQTSKILRSPFFCIRAPLQVFVNGP